MPFDRSLIVKDLRNYKAGLNLACEFTRLKGLLSKTKGDRMGCLLGCTAIVS